MELGIQTDGKTLGKVALLKAYDTDTGIGDHDRFSMSGSQPGLSWAKLLRSLDTPLSGDNSKVVNPTELAALHPSAPNEYDVLTAG